MSIHIYTVANIRQMVIVFFFLFGINNSVRMFITVIEITWLFEIHIQDFEKQSITISYGISSVKLIYILS